MLYSAWLCAPVSLRNASLRHQHQQLVLVANHSANDGVPTPRARCTPPVCRGAADSATAAWKTAPLLRTSVTHAMRIELDDLRRPAIHALLDEHLAQMRATSPPESVHALDLDRLRAPSITFWSIWDGDTLLGCGALKQLDPQHGEIKSMRTPQQQRRRGAGRAMLEHLVAEARRRGYHRLSLETGSQRPWR